MANKPSLHKNALHTKKNCATLHFEKCFTRYHQILCYGVIVVIRRHHCVHIIHRNVCTAHFRQCAVCSVHNFSVQCAECSVQWVQCALGDIIVVI